MMAVWKLHRRTRLTEALITFSGIVLGKFSSKGVLWNSACIGRQTRRYCPLAFEVNAVKKEYIHFTVFSVSHRITNNVLFVLHHGTMGRELDG